MRIGLQKRATGLLNATGRVSGAEDGLVTARKPQRERDLPATSDKGIWLGCFRYVGDLPKEISVTGTLPYHVPLLSTIPPSAAGISKRF